MTKVLTTLILLFSLLVLGVFSASAETILRLGHIFPPMTAWHKDALMPWVQEVEKESQGRIKIHVYPMGQLGKVMEMTNNIRTGYLDIGLVLPLLETGRYPFADIFNVTSPDLKRDLFIVDHYLVPMYFTEFKFLCAWPLSSNIVMGSRPILKLDDLRGKVVGYPGGRALTMLLREINVAPTQSNVSDMYQMLDKKIVDAHVAPPTTLLGQRLVEVTKSVLIMDMGRESWFLLMNQSSWDRLPDEDKKIFTRMIPKLWASQHKIHNGYRETCLNAVRELGNPVVELSREDKIVWDGLVKNVREKWVDDMEKKGLPASKLLGVLK